MGSGAIYLNVYVPLLQTPAVEACYLRGIRDYQVPSSALLAPMTRAFVNAIERFVKDRGIDPIRFQRGERKAAPRSRMPTTPSPATISVTQR